MLQTLFEGRQRGAGAFVVDPVIPAITPIPTEALADHISERFQRKVLFLPNAEKPVANRFFDPAAPKVPLDRTRYRLRQKLVSRCHPMIDAIATAFGEHRPLILSPDSIWLAIEQGFAHYLAENAEALRHRLVRHQGSRELSTKIHEMSPAFALGISDLSEQIRRASDPVLHETLICDFSTTTPTIRTAGEVLLMNCYSSYFTYEMMGVCGIPKVTVLGSVDDWQRIRARVEVLETFDLRWWVAVFVLSSMSLYELLRAAPTCCSGRRFINLNRNMERSSSQAESLIFSLI